MHLEHPKHSIYIYTECITPAHVLAAIATSNARDTVVSLCQCAASSLCYSIITCRVVLPCRSTAQLRRVDASLLCAPSHHVAPWRQCCLVITGGVRRRDGAAIWGASGCCVLHRCIATPSRRVASLCRVVVSPCWYVASTRYDKGARNACGWCLSAGAACGLGTHLW